MLIIAVVLGWPSLASAARTIAVGEVQAESDVADEAGAVTLLVHSAIAGVDATLVAMPGDMTIPSAPMVLTKANIQHAILMDLSRDGTGLRLTLAILHADGGRKITYVRAGDGDVVALAKGVVEHAATECALTKRSVADLPFGSLRPYAAALRLRKTHPDDAARALADAVPATALSVSSIGKLLAPLTAASDPTLAAIAARALRDAKRLAELGAGTDAAATGARALAALARSSTQEAEQALGAKPPRHGLVTLAQVMLAENGSDLALLEARIKAGLVSDQVRPVLAIAATLVPNRVSAGLHRALVGAADKLRDTAPGVAARIGLNAAEAGVDLPRALALINARELEVYDLTRLDTLIAKRTDVASIRLRAEVSLRRADGLESAAIAEWIRVAPTDPRALRYQSWVLTSESKFAEAATALQKTGTLRERARALDRAGDPRAALALIGTPATAEDHVIVTHVALLDKRTADATTALATAERLAPISPVVHHAIIELDTVAPDPTRAAVSRLVVAADGETQVKPVVASNVNVSTTELDTGPSIKVTAIAIDPALIEPLLSALTRLQQMRGKTVVLAEMRWERSWKSFRVAHSEPVKAALVNVLSALPYKLNLRGDPVVLPDGPLTSASLARVTGDAHAALIYRVAATDRGAEVALTFYERDASDAASVSKVLNVARLSSFDDSKLKMILAFVGVFVFAAIVYITRAKGRIKLKIERAPDVSDEVFCIEISKTSTRPRVDDPLKFANDMRKIGTVTKARHATLIASGYTAKVSTGTWFVHLYGAFARAGKVVAVPATCTQEVLVERGELVELKFDLTSKLAELRIEVLATQRRGLPVWVTSAEHDKAYTDEQGEAVLNLPVGTYTLCVEAKGKRIERPIQITALKQHRESINVERELRIEAGVKLDLPPESTAPGTPASAVHTVKPLPGPLTVALPPAPAPAAAVAKLASAETAYSPALSTPQLPVRSPRAETPRPGDTLLGRYRIKAELGRGAMGVVHRAWDEKLEREVAIKEMADDLRANPDAMRLFTQEAKALAQLNHTNIVAMYDQLTDASGVYMIMEFVDGQPLADIARARGAMPWLEAVGVVDQVCAGLAYAHARKIIHRDIKPANCFVAHDRTVKLGDFGLARVMREVTIHRTEIRGTPLYMAPEQITGTNVDHRADLYAVGCMLFELLTGRPPFIDGDILYAQMHLPPPRASAIAEELPPALDELLLSLLAKQADDRPGSANEVRTAFKQLFAS